MYRWFEDAKVGNDIVISSRIRLARNLADFMFSSKISSEQTDKMLSKAGQGILRMKETEHYRDYILDDLEEIQKAALSERHVISDYLASQQKGLFFVSEDEKNVIMVNEEDHIRIQCMEAGRNLRSAYERANKLDDALGRQVEYAFDDNFGYLTSCPTNVGTGMKASYMLHLPALGNSKKIQELIGEVGHFGINMKGMYGEDGSGCGHIYQISNQKTMGQTEEEIIANLDEIATQIINREKECRKQIQKQDRLALEDEIYKSYGILKYSRKLTYKDAMLFLSELRLGLSMKLLAFTEETEFIVYQLMIGIQPANLRLIAGVEATDEELDEVRASFIRENIPLIN